MRVCIQKSTGKIIDSQSNPTEGALTQNAINYGFNLADIEEKEITEDELQSLLDAQPKPNIPKSEIEILKETVDLLVLQALEV